MSRAAACSAGSMSRRICVALYDRAHFSTFNSVALVAALVGFDRREPVTIPPLQEGERWDVLQAARQGLLSQIRQSAVAPRYLTQA